MITAMVSDDAPISFKKSLNIIPKVGTEPIPQTIEMVTPLSIKYPQPPSGGIKSYFLPSLIISIVRLDLCDLERMNYRFKLLSVILTL